MTNEKEIELHNIGPVRLVKHNKAKRIKITVKPRDIRVTIPVSASFSDGEKFAYSRLEWIKKVREKFPAKSLFADLADSGELFRTRNHIYRAEPAEINFLKVSYLKEREIILFQYPEKFKLTSPELERALKYAIDEMLRKEAKQYLPARTGEIGGRMGLKYKKVFIKNNKSNWGSCSSLGNINLNLHLMRLPDRLIDFVIVHELTHTIIPNHGPRFKEMMRGIFPDSQRLNNELKKHNPNRYF